MQFLSDKSMGKVPEIDVHAAADNELMLSGQPTAMLGQDARRYRRVCSRDARTTEHLCRRDARTTRGTEAAAAALWSGLTGCWAFHTVQLSHVAERVQSAVAARYSIDLVPVLPAKVEETAMHRFALVAGRQQPPP